MALLQKKLPVTDLRKKGKSHTELAHSICKLTYFNSSPFDIMLPRRDPKDFMFRKEKDGVAPLVKPPGSIAGYAVQLLLLWRNDPQLPCCKATT
eukprot:885317-Pelagomonas_calceolata.AAC.1